MRHRHATFGEPVQPVGRMSLLPDLTLSEELEIAGSKVSVIDDTMGGCGRERDR